MQKEAKVVGREVEVYFSAEKLKEKKPAGGYREFVKSLNVEFEDGEFCVLDEPYRFV